MPSVTLDWLHVVILLGALQGLFLAGVLATKRRNRTANRLLAAAMLAFTLGLASAVYQAAGLVRVFPHFFGVGYPLPVVFGPVVYLYAVAAADRHHRFGWRDALHLAPFAAVVVASLPVYMMSGADKVALYERLQAGADPPLFTIVGPLQYASGAAYSTLTVVFLHRHRERVKESYSSTEQVSLRWLLRLGVAAAVIWATAIGLRFAIAAGAMPDQRQDDVVSLAVALLVCAVGYMGLRQPEIFRYETAEHRIPAELWTPVTPPMVPAEPEAAPSRYERSGLTSLEAERLRLELTRVMEEERPWLDSELTLADLAARLSTTPHRVSEVLNSEVGQSFFDFVNGYRVREVQRRLAAREARDTTMLSLAMDAGFASKSTFNLVFKKMTGQTPSDFRQRVRA